MIRIASAKKKPLLRSGFFVRTSTQGMPVLPATQLLLLFAGTSFNKGKESLVECVQGGIMNPRVVTILLVSVALTACGTDVEVPEFPAEESVPLTLEISGAAFEHESLEAIVLTADVAGGSGETTVLWKQTDGPALGAAGTGVGEDFTFVAPWLAEPSTITFQVSAVDGSGTKATENVVLSVLPLGSSGWRLGTFDFDFNLMSGASPESEFLEEVEGIVLVRASDAYGNEVFPEVRFEFEPGEPQEIALPVNSESLKFHVQTFTGHPDYSNWGGCEFCSGKDISYQEFAISTAEPISVPVYDDALYAYLEFDEAAGLYNVTLRNSRLEYEYPRICEVQMLDFLLWGGPDNDLLAYAIPINRIDDPNQACIEPAEGLIQFSIAVAEEHRTFLTEGYSSWEMFLGREHINENGDPVVQFVYGQGDHFSVDDVRIY